jgi:hypothetical protein
MILLDGKELTTADHGDHISASCGNYYKSIQVSPDMPAEKRKQVRQEVLNAVVQQHTADCEKREEERATKWQRR